MYNYILKRILLMIPTLFGAAVLVFFLLRLIPGDVCELRLAGTGLYADPAEIELCQEKLGLNQPMILQFFDFLIGIVTFDLGESMWTGKPIFYGNGPSVRTFPADCDNGDDHLHIHCHSFGNHFRDQAGYLD